MKNYKKYKINWLKNSVFNSLWHTKLVKQFMLKGNLALSERIFITFLKKLRQVTKLQSFFIFEALFLIKPLMLIQQVRSGNTWHSIPRFIPKCVQYTAGIRILSKIVKTNKDYIYFYDKLINEFLKIMQSKDSDALSFRENLYSVIEYNKAFASFRW